MDNYIGKKIEGRYQITELIGVGGMANVYKAVDVADGKTVAVKLLREEFYSNEELLRRFKNESKAIAMLSHPNIIKVYDVCFSHRMQSIVMEYVDGITLKEYMGQQGALSWKEALHFLLQILCALSHAHDKGIVHRDIKPQNVMLLTDGSIKITDFGIARFARSEAKTLTNRAIGSVHYISPEQARGEHTDQRADIYSVGVMLFEMLTGQLPFDADSPVSVALKQIQIEAPSPRSIRSDIPEGLEEITVRAMQKDPDRRYQSAGEMLRDIEVFKQNPSAHFEYKYLNGDQPDEVKYRRAIRNIRNREKQGPERSPRGEKRMPRRKTGAPRAAPPAKRGGDAQGNYTDAPSGGGSVIMALSGITAAFVVISALFIGAMLYLNNPLEKVPDIVVPDLMGLRYEAVKNAGEYEGLVLEVEDSQYNELYERGAIVSQKPRAGTKVKENSVVRLVISNGQKVVKMPNLFGLEETEAYRQLAELDLDYQKIEVFSEQPAGTVIATDPGYDSEIPAQTVVKLHISMGPENKVVQVPDVVGLPLEEARARLTEVGLEVGGISYVVSDKPYDTVTSQDPAPTSQISTGGFVNLNVSGGENQKNVITLSIPLPDQVTEIVKLQAMFDGRILREERLQPSTAHYWRPAFEGSGTAKIFILYNDFLYQTYEVNFSNGSYQCVEDNSDAHI
jgi:serine/threonine protein kinase/beta-lactam-binding protein with PASTA domain